MSSPFQIGFMGKNPMKTIKLNDKDLNSTKSASSNDKPLALTPSAAQGGTDYEAQLAASEAENPEGQGGKNYEADDSVAKMNSPLDKAGARGKHPNHMKAGADNSGNPNAATPSEYWRVHQQKSHHKAPPKAEDKKKLKA